MWGIGAKTAAKLHARGIHRVGDIAAMPEEAVVAILGRASGHHVHALSHNRDARPVRTGRRRRSIGSQRALGRSPRTAPAIDAVLVGLVDRVTRRLRAARRVGRTVMLRLRFDDFTRATRSHTLDHATADTATILSIARGLLEASMPRIGREGVDAGRADDRQPRRRRRRAADAAVPPSRPGRRRARRRQGQVRLGGDHPSGAARTRRRASRCPACRTDCAPSSFRLAAGQIRPLCYTRVVTTAAAVLTDDETSQLDRANASGRTPVVFVHGLWLLASSWDRWVGHFEDAGYSAVDTGLARRPADRRRSEGRSRRCSPASRSATSPITSSSFVRRLARKPAVIGHSFGGLLTQILAGRGLAAASVAIDPAPHRGVLPAADLVAAVGVSGAAQPTQPSTRRGPHVRAVPLRLCQRRRRGRGATSSTRSSASPAPACRCSRRRSPTSTRGREVKVDTKNPARGPLLVISGEHDHTIPRAIAKASFNRQQRNQGVTEFAEIAGRGHSLTIDSGWQDVADTALAFVRRFT